MSQVTVVLLLLGIAGFYAAPSERIVGGSDAYLGQFPHQVSMQINGQHFCGGSIISPTKILTAAHCVYGMNEVMEVVAGINNLSQRGQRVRVAKSYYYGGYIPSKIVNDIAILILEAPLSYDEYVQPIALATSNPPEGAVLALSGWGLTSFPGNIPNQLKQITLTNINLQTCAQQMVGYTNPITTANVCTTSPPGFGACQGDSGGPLIYGGIQVGVVSWGIPCAKGRPDVFTSVAFFNDWIEKTN